MKKQLTLGIVGATGVVGQSVLELLKTHKFKFSIKQLKLYASQNSIGKVIQFYDQSITLESPNIASLAKCDVVIFASDAAISRKFIPDLAKKNIVCIDKSSAFRSDPQVPLVVPEVNGSILFTNNNISSYIVASPNCIVIPLAIVANVVKDILGLKTLIVSTYQSVSGTGSGAVDILLKESKEFLNAQDLTCAKSVVYPKSIAFNVIPFVESLDKEGHTGEEKKIKDETKKVLGDSFLSLDVTSVRVPTFVGHAMSVVCETKTKYEKEKILAALKQQKAIKVSTPTNFMTPREVHGKNEVFVSRIRASEAFSGGLSFWIACDNLRKGAALNALQIVEYILTKRTKNG